MPRRLPFLYDTNYDKLEPAELIARPFEVPLDAILHDLRAMPHRAQVLPTLIEAREFL